MRRARVVLERKDYTGERECLAGDRGHEEALKVTAVVCTTCSTTSSSCPDTNY